MTKPPILQFTKDEYALQENPEDSFTLPARFYHDSDIHELEKEAILYCNWWYAGHISQLQTPGDFISTRIADQNVFVIRDRTHSIKGFYNVCQHRGHELVNGCGHANVIVCPYHAWSYDLDGTLKSARNTDKMPGFDKCDFSLKEIRVEIFCGLVFINLDAHASPLATQAAGLESEIRSFCPTVDDLAFAQRDTYNVESNWKVMVDNFLECYHCHTAHRDFVSLVDMDSYRSTVHDIYSSHVSRAAKSTNNAAYKFDVGDVDFGYAGWFLWPNTTIWAYPGEPNLSVLQMIPNGAGDTIEHQDWFVPDGKPSEQLTDAMAYQKDVLQPEDIGLCESVQKGLKSKGYNQGRFIIDDKLSHLSEHAVHHFQRLVLNSLEGFINK